MVTRFAPSPTGELHLGHAYAAKVAHNLAKNSGGRFLLRFEDIDISRVRDHFYEAILTDLRWLGLDWDGATIRQSERQSAYQQTLASLKEMGLIYPCFCSRADVREALAAPHGPNTHIYPGTCRQLSRYQIEQKMAENKPFSWRLDSQLASETSGPLEFHDQRFGTIAVDPLKNGDEIVARRDIGIAYHLAVVIDDAFQGVTHVTRGEDLLDATHIHRQLQSILKLPVPTYLHHPCITNDAGERLAKRDNALTLRNLREQGLSKDDLLGMLDVKH